MRFSTKRFLLLGVSSFVSGLFFVCFLASRNPVATVEEVDISAELKKLLEERYQGQVNLPVDKNGDPIFVREPISEEVARKLFPALRGHGNGRYIFDPQAYFVERPYFRGYRPFREHPAGGWNIVTNNMGFRGKRDVRPQKAGLRILVTGDSHTFGLVPNSETFVSLTEEFLSHRLPEDVPLEILNAGVGAYSFFNYVGVYEKNLFLRPDIFVVTVYGGNDLLDVIPLAHYFLNLPPLPDNREYMELLVSANAIARKAMPQALRQVWFFHNHPEFRKIALSTGVAATLEIQRLCKKHETTFVCVYLPSVFESQSELLSDKWQQLLDFLKLPPKAIELNNALGDVFVDEVSRHGVHVVDMRPYFAKASHLLFWHSDNHLNTAGHRMVAQVLADTVEKLIKNDGALENLCTKPEPRSFRRK